MQLNINTQRLALVSCQSRLPCILLLEFCDFAAAKMNELRVPLRTDRVFFAVAWVGVRGTLQNIPRCRIRRLEISEFSGLMSRLKRSTRYNYDMRNFLIMYKLMFLMYTVARQRIICLTIMSAHHLNARNANYITSIDLRIKTQRF